MPTLHLLRVFCSDDGSGGNPLGVFLDGGEVAPERRQAVAADLGLSEIVFVDDAERGEIRIFTPTVELDFAGHPAVGTAWLLDGVDCAPPAGGRGAGAPRRRERLRGRAARVGTAARARPARLAGRGGGARRSAGRTRPRDGLGVDRRGRRDDPRARASRPDRDCRGRGHRLGGHEAVRTARARRSTSGRGAARASWPGPGDDGLRGDRRPQRRATTCATTRCPERTARRSCAGSEAPRPRRPRATRSRPR